MTIENGITLEIASGKAINKTFESIYSRRAVRKFKELSVEKDIIMQIVDAGRMAPSAMNRQPWKFYVLTDKKEIKAFSKEIGKASFKGISKIKIGDAGKAIVSALLHPHDLSFFKGDDFIFHGAPVVIFITAPKDNDWAALDIGACAQNMMLAAKSIGIDSCPVGLAKFVEDTKIYGTLHIPEKERVMLAVIFGYGNEVPEIHKRKKDNLIFID